MLEKIKKNNKGFTLVELIVVIAILGVLMAVLVPQYIQYVERSKEGTDISALGEILHVAEIEAAVSEATPAAITVKVDATTHIISVETADTVMKNALDQAISGGALQSKDGRLIGTCYIVFDGNKPGWANAADGTGATTDVFFTGLKDGKATNAKPFA